MLLWSRLNQKGKIMKAILLVLGTAALLLGGCATYYGSTADESGVVQGYDNSYGRPTYIVDPAYPGVRPMYPMYPIYKQPSPSGNDMGDARPEIMFYR
jgi:hypothetical protein